MKTKQRNPNIPIDGEMQFDAAVSERVAEKKFSTLPSMTYPEGAMP